MEWRDWTRERGDVLKSEPSVSAGCFEMVNVIIPLPLGFSSLGVDGGSSFAIGETLGQNEREAPFRLPDKTSSEAVVAVGGTFRGSPKGGGRGRAFKAMAGGRSSEGPVRSGGFGGTLILNTEEAR